MAVASVQEMPGEHGLYRLISEIANELGQAEECSQAKLKKHFLNQAADNLDQKLHALSSHGQVSV